MTWPRLLLIADHRACGSDEAWLALVAELASLHPLPVSAAVQLRIKDADPAIRRLLLERALAAPRSLSVTINGTLAEATALGADGVHWAEAAIPGETPPVMADLALRGASIHSPEAAHRAARAGADYLVFAPVFAPRSKAGHGRGLDALRTVVEACSLPVLALGGVDAGRVRSCLRAGAAGVATVGALLTGPGPATVARSLAAALASD